ncbi:KGG domain-containing protein [Siminovitchia fortis]|uniref:KGG domain-containing protein n=1 Tax=Siminovitchia fortis TaxID=254758 RepID=UPI00119CDCD3|nr:general stress protein [Siminovitchia fortis]
MADKKNNDHKMTVEEAGRKGGEATARNHDKEFYKEIGRKGGEATSKNHDKDFYEEIGHKGGKARAEQHDDNKKSASALPIDVQTGVPPTR